MPTINPRVNVTLSPSLDRLVQRMASHQRVSKSQVLRELLEAAEPALQRAVTLMDAAEKAGAAVRSSLARGLEKAQDSIEDAAAIALYRMDSATSDLVAEAEKVRGRRSGGRRRTSLPPGASPKGGPASGVVGVPGAGGAAQNPPASNRGVKSRKQGSRGGVITLKKGAA